MNNRLICNVLRCLHSVSFKVFSLTGVLQCTRWPLQVMCALSPTREHSGPIVDRHVSTSANASISSPLYCTVKRDITVYLRSEHYCRRTSKQFPIVYERPKSQIMLKAFSRLHTEIFCNFNSFKLRVTVKMLFAHMYSSMYKLHCV